MLSNSILTCIERLPFDDLTVIVNRYSYYISIRSRWYMLFLYCNSSISDVFQYIKDTRFTLCDESQVLSLTGLSLSITSGSWPELRIKLKLVLDAITPVMNMQFRLTKLDSTVLYRTDHIELIARTNRIRSRVCKYFPVFIELLSEAYCDERIRDIRKYDNCIISTSEQCIEVKILRPGYIKTSSTGLSQDDGHALSEVLYIKVVDVKLVDVISQLRETVVRNSCI